MQGVSQLSNAQMDALFVSTEFFAMFHALGMVQCGRLALFWIAGHLAQAWGIM